MVLNNLKICKAQSKIIDKVMVEVMEAKEKCNIAVRNSEFNKEVKLPKFI